MEALDLDVATEFLLIAATLVELKARRLLPEREDVDLDDELVLWEERDLLLARLLECKTFKDAAGVLRRLSDHASRSFPRRAGPEERFVALTPDLLEGVTALDVRNAFLRATAPKPVPRVDLTHVAPVRLSVAEAVAELVDELPRIGRITFRRLTDGLVERMEVIVRFLALLELFKQGLVDLDQADTFGDIEMCWTGGELDGDGELVRAAGRRHRRLRGLGRDRAERRRRPVRRRPRRPRAAGRAGRRRAGHRGHRAGRHRSRPARTCWPSSWSCRSSPWRSCASGWPRPTTRPATASSSCGWPAATGTRAIRTWRPTSSASCWRARAPGCRRPRWRRWPSWPTSSRSPGPRSRPSAGSTPTPCCAPCRAGATSTRSAATRAPARRCCGARRPSSWSGWAWTRWPTCRRSPTSCPGADVVEALETGLRVTGRSTGATTSRTTAWSRPGTTGSGPSRARPRRWCLSASRTGRATDRRGSASRRCWPSGATAAAGSARS